MPAFCCRLPQFQMFAVCQTSTQNVIIVIAVMVQVLQNLRQATCLATWSTVLLLVTLKLTGIGIKVEQGKFINCHHCLSV